MRNVWTIAWRDFKSYFTSPIAYLILAGFLFIVGWMFFWNLNNLAMQAGQAAMMGGKVPTLTEGLVRPLYGNMNVIFLFFVPGITMRLLAEERKTQTLALLLTSPVTLTEIIVGKFLSAFLLVLVMTLATFVYPLLMLVTGAPDPGTILTSALGTLLLTSCYLAVGVFFSAMTENQIVACLLTFAAGLFFWLISWATMSAGPVWSDILMFVSLLSHYNNFSQGMITSADVFYYLSFIGIGLFLTHRVLDSYRWR
jgi:ABC-2 type transport system permease protein